MHNRNTKTTAPDAASTQRILADQQWARDHALELSQRYPNQWVAIHDQRVIAAAHDQWQATVRAQARGQFPITFVHTCPPRVPGIGDAILSPPAADAIPVDIRATGRPIDARMLATELRDLRYRSVSFDLHGTLVCSKRPWKEHIAHGICEVLIAHGFDDVPAQLERTFGERTADVIVYVAKDWYRKHARLVRNDQLAILFWNPSATWSFANARALADLVEYFGNDARIPADQDLPPHVRSWPRIGQRLYAVHARRGARPTTSERRRAQQQYPDLYTTDPIAAVYALRHGAELTRMAVEIHERISGSPPESWETTEEQRMVLRTALEHGHLCCVLSNGSAEAVQRCVAAHLSGIPPWQVYTPDAFHRAGKPSPMNAALLLASIGSAMIRNAIESRSAPDLVATAVAGRNRARLRERWRRANVQLTQSIASSVDPQRGDDALAVVRGTLTGFVRALHFPPDVRDAILVLPHEHLHVGNSDYHDQLPVLGLGLPFHCVRYAPTDAPALARAIQPFPATALHPVPGFDDRNGAP